MSGKRFCGSLLVSVVQCGEVWQSVVKCSSEWFRAVHAQLVGIRFITSGYGTTVLIIDLIQKLQRKQLRHKKSNEI